MKRISPFNLLNHSVLEVFSKQMTIQQVEKILFALIALVLFHAFVDLCYLLKSISDYHKEKFFDSENL
jgi:hypothetical protein